MLLTRWALYISGHMTTREPSNFGPSLHTRASTAHGSRPALNIPVPTPVSSRPHTATGGPEIQHPHPPQVHVKPHPPPMSLQQQIEKALEFKARQQEVEVSLKGKLELGHKKSFRLAQSLGQCGREMEGIFQYFFLQVCGCCTDNSHKTEGKLAWLWAEGAMWWSVKGSNKA